ncbi:hypothetical protein SAMN06266787_1307 [Halorubrum ezzemoulense]|uniref:Uncharacterized protein n=1 Tax=Halorubrum ezzemoulense TaxID=337243 RepID=A0A238Z5X6_HALEZ|nr:hypothetical protein SAMN06266787_1307 [Halorubrum ezzemoulense]
MPAGIAAPLERNIRTKLLSWNIPVGTPLLEVSRLIMSFFSCHLREQEPVAIWKRKGMIRAEGNIWEFPGRGNFDLAKIVPNRVDIHDRNVGQILISGYEIVPLLVRSGTVHAGHHVRINLVVDGEMRRSSK